MKEREENGPWLRHVLMAWKAAMGVQDTPSGAGGAGPVVGTGETNARTRAMALRKSGVAGNAVARLVGYARLVLQRDIPQQHFKQRNKCACF